jgi:hypothetical protein
MNAIRLLALAASLTVPVALPAAAMTVPAFNAPAATTASVLVVDPLASGRVDAVAAAENYFEFDALVTLGALALAGGGLAAHTARRRTQKEVALSEPAWRQSVLAAVQADLSRFSETLRRAA